jgi:two-component system, cell cycle sensor histidine kinase and response regulator CckA
VSPTRTAAPRPTILLVDDDANMLSLIHRILPSAHFEVVEAQSLAAALALAASATTPFDLLLTDVMMPNGTGTALAQQLRERWPDLRVLYMSGYGVSALTNHALGGANDFVQKPFAPKDLRERVRRLLAEKPQ